MIYNAGKVRLFNVWATWCQPCVEEMPALSDIGRKFSRREFEMISISLDTPTDKDKVAKFLGKHRVVMSAKLKKSVEAEGRTTNNYRYTGANTDALAEALDPEWPGPVPYTLIIDGDGKPIYRKSGEIDPAVIRKTLLDTLTSYHNAPKPGGK